MITPGQIKAARAILGWSQEQLALMCGLAKNTIYNLESDCMSPRPASEKAIRDACEKAGLEFIEPDGVKRIPTADTIRVFRGLHACEEFFQDMHWYLSEKGGDVIALFRSQKLLEDICNITPDNIARIKRITEVSSVRCLLAETQTGEGELPPFSYRYIAMHDAGAASYFVYGNKHTVVLPQGHGDFLFLSYISTQLAEAHRSHFQLVWSDAPSVNSGTVRNIKAVRR